MESSFGIKGAALNWMEAYLTGRTQKVVIQEAQSEESTLDFGVPQGSVLGPKKFCNYTKPIGKIIQKHRLQYHIYADDTQIYTVSDMNSINENVARIESCIRDVRRWMQTNKLKLNDSKTEVIIFGTKQKLQQLQDIRIQIGDEAIRPSKTVKNLGVHMDQELKMDSHVNSICKTANFHIHNIRRIRKFLTKDATKSLTNALVTSRLDYGNALLYGTTANLRKKMQKVQNSSARLITYTPRREHMTPVLRSLHWLPINKRLQYKILLCTYNSFQGTAPQYISDILPRYHPVRGLRSQAQRRLTPASTRTSAYGKRFEAAAPTLWNQLPTNIKELSTIPSFKKALKTFLFNHDLAM